MWHPQSNPEAGLVWGPEVHTDKDTGQPSTGHLSSLCNSDWHRRKSHSGPRRWPHGHLFQVYVCEHDLYVHGKVMFANMICEHHVGGDAEPHKASAVIAQNILLQDDMTADGYCRRPLKPMYMACSNLRVQKRNGKWVGT